MFDFVKRLWFAAPIATIILAVALAMSLFFAGKTAVFLVYWNDPVHREQQIAPWMTPGYIAHSWRVPREVVLQALDAPVPPPGGRMNLEALADYHGVTVDDLIAAVEAAIADYNSAAPTEPENRDHSE